MMKWYLAKEIDLYLFHDKLCDKLVEALVKHLIDVDDFDYFYTFHDEIRNGIARDALIKAFIYEL